MYRMAQPAVWRHSLKTTTFTAILEKEGDGFCALCPELDVASQGNTVEVALHNLREAAELFLECADESEIAERPPSGVCVVRFEAVHG